MTDTDKLVSVVLPVFEDGERALTAVRTMLRQVVVEGFDVEVIAVDDGSRDATSQVLSQCQDERFKLLRLEHNEGRSAARNTGARYGQGSVIVFMDCDCAPVDSHFLAAHVSTLQRGYVASTGDVIGVDSGFWARYQQAASQRRKRQHALGASYAGSSQNLAVTRPVFERVGGFDTHYQHYGFEDRDLLLRVADVGEIGWSDKAVVRHLDTLTLAEVCDKMMTAGRYSAERFAQCHATAYQTLGYAAIDARLHPWLRIVAATLGRLSLTVAPMLDPLIRHLPYPIAKGVVKVSVALAFLYGTSRDQAQEKGR